MKFMNFAVCTAMLAASLPASASVEKAAIGYEILNVSRPSETELSTFTIEWTGLDTSLWGAYVHYDYRTDEYDASKLVYTLDVKRNGKSVTRCSPAEDINPIYNPYSSPLHYSHGYALAEAQTRPGTYTIELPRGLVCNTLTPSYATYVNDAAVLTFVIEGEGRDDIDDDDDTPQIPDGTMALVAGAPSVDTPDSIETITWEWTTAAQDACHWFGPASLDVTDASGEVVARAAVSNSGRNILLTLDLPIEITGRYNIYVPQAAIANADDFSSATIFNDAATLEYVVIAPSGLHPVGIYPGYDARLSYASGETLESIAVNYSTGITMGDKIPFLFTEQGERIYAEGMQSFLYDAQGGFSIKFPDAKNLKTGKYVLIIPRGTIVGGEAVRVNYYWEEKPADITKEDPLTFLVARVQNPGGATFNLLDPDNGVDFIEDQSRLTLSTNYDDICDTYYYRILDVTGMPADFNPDDAEPIIASFMHASPGFSHLIYGPQAKPYKLSADKEYAVVVECYSDYQTALRKFHGIVTGPRFRGGAEPYKYSEARLLKVTPTPGGELNSSSTIVMAFDRPVSFNYEQSGIPMGQMGSERFATYASNEDGTEWRFTVASSSIENFSGPNSINLRFAFNDEAGLRVRPSNLNVPESDNITPLRNMGTDANSTICVWYGTYAGCAAFNVTPAHGSTVKSLYEFSYTTNACGGELNPSWLGHKLNVTDAEGNVVATMICDSPTSEGGNVHLTQTGTADDPKTTKVTLHLDKEVTAPGTYTISYPYAYFAMGREEDASNSRPTEHTYVIEGNSQTGTDAIIDADGIVEVYSMDGCHVATMKYSEVSTLHSGIYIVVTQDAARKIRVR